MYRYEDGQGLEDSLYAAIHVYDDTRTNYWLDGDQSELFEILDRLGQMAVAVTDELVVSEDLAKVYSLGNTAKSVLESLGPSSKIALEHIQIVLAFRFCTDVVQRSARCLELTEYVLQAKPAEPVLKYLRRLTRCYIEGALPECVMLCRAVLENALLERFKRSAVPVPANSAGKSEMAVRLSFARKANWISAQSETDAWAVWQRGSKAVHNDPEVTKDVLGTLRLTMNVVSQLYA